MVPFFGGRSTLWSGWTPRPNQAKGEVEGWGKGLTDIMYVNSGTKFFEDAETMCGTRQANQISNPEIPAKFHIYAQMQNHLQKKLSKAIDKNYVKGKKRHGDLPYATVAFGAPLAVADESDPLIAFVKYSVVGPYLKLLHDEVKHVTCTLDCVVTRIIQHPGVETLPDGTSKETCVPTALETSRGILPLDKDTKIILAVGCMPAATLLLNSFPREVIPNVGTKFGAHIITAITAKVPLSTFSIAQLNQFELGAIYLAGIVDCDKVDKDGKKIGTRTLSFHAQISVLRVDDPKVNYAKKRPQALRYMPDVVATASDQAMLKSDGDVVFVCALLGEMDVENPVNSFKMMDPHAADKTSNCILDYSIGHTDQQLWDKMDETGEF